MATTLQHFTGIDNKFGQIVAALATKSTIPSNEGTFAPTLIDLSGGQKEYNAYTQVGAIAFALDPAKTPVIGGAVQVNIRGANFAITYPSNFVGLEGLTSGTVLATGVDYPFVFKLAKDWAQVSPGVFEDRVLVIAGRGPTAATHQAVSVAAAASYAIPRSSSRILVELTDAVGVDLNTNGTFALPGSPQAGDAIIVVRHVGGLGLWSRTGGDSSDVLRGRDDLIEYQWSGSAWVRTLQREQQVLRVNQATYTVSGGDHLLDLVFHTTSCVVTLPNNLGTRTRFRLVQEGAAVVTVTLAGGALSTPTTSPPLATAGDGTALAVTVIGNATGTAARYRLVREHPVPSTGGGGLTPTADIKTATYTALVNEAVRTNTAGGSFNVAMPVGAAEGAIVGFEDNSPTSWSATNYVQLHTTDGAGFINEETGAIQPGGLSDGVRLDGGNSSLWRKTGANWKFIGQTGILSGGGGVTDHGALTGLSDNDHPQYALTANPVFTGTVTVPDGALAIADTNGLQAALELGSWPDWPAQGPTSVQLERDRHQRDARPAAPVERHHRWADHRAGQLHGWGRRVHRGR